MAFLKCCFLIFFLTSCSQLTYLAHTTKGQLSLYNHERPIHEVINDKQTSDFVRERLKWVSEIKTFVESTLGVPATGNYQTFVNLNRPYVVWALTVAEPYRLFLKEWKFPFFGSFPYLGFFDLEVAKNWSQKLESQGYDVHLRGVTAYSTLGYLRDPLLSSMLSQNKSDMVNLIFHESLHGLIYLKGEGAFNEQIATFFGDFGERYWIIKTYGSQSKELLRWENERVDRRKLSKLLGEFAEELKNFYAKGQDLNKLKQNLAQQKLQKFEEFRNRLKKEAWLVSGKQIQLLSDSLINNAALLGLLTYEDNQSLFESLNGKCKNNLRLALQFVHDFRDQYQTATDRDQSKLLQQSIHQAFEHFLKEKKCT